MNKDSRIVFVGLGLLGGSYARGLAAAGFQNLAGIDCSQQTIDFALQHGYITQGAVAQFEPLLQQADFVVFSLYPTAFIQWVKEYGAHLPAGCICTDVCGVKEGIAEAVQALLPTGVEFIASHPMAGKEVSGVQNSHLVDFSAANFLITPTPQNTPQGIAFAADLAKTLGFAHIHQLSPAAHDQMIGYVSQLTHAIAVSLMCAPDAENFADYTGDSFRDLTRIANINAPMWAELFLWNKQNLAQEIDTFTERLQQMKTYLLQGNRAALEAMMRQASAARAAFNRKEKEG